MSKYVAEVIEVYGAVPSSRPLDATSDESAKEAAYGLTADLPRTSSGGRVVLWREEPGEGRIRIGEWGWSGFEVLGFIWSGWGI